MATNRSEMGFTWLSSPPESTVFDRFEEAVVVRIVVTGGTCNAVKRVLASIVTTLLLAAGLGAAARPVSGERISGSRQAPIKRSDKLQSHPVNAA